MNTLEIFHRDNPSWVKLALNDKRAIRWINKYKHLDVIVDYYDHLPNSDQVTWMDIEGIDYGWLWCSVPRFFKKIGLQDYVARHKIRNYAKGVLKDELDVYCVYLDGCKSIAVIAPNNITYIRLSNKELSPYD